MGRFVSEATLCLLGVWPCPWVSRLRLRAFPVRPIGRVAKRILPRVSHPPDRDRTESFGSDLKGIAACIGVARNAPHNESAPSPMGLRFRLHHREGHINSPSTTIPSIVARSGSIHRALIWPTATVIWITNVSLLPDFADEY